MMAYDKICDAIPQKQCNEDEAMENEARQKKPKPITCETTNILLTPKKEKKINVKKTKEQINSAKTFQHISVSLSPPLVFHSVEH